MKCRKCSNKGSTAITFNESYVKSNLQFICLCTITTVQQGCICTTLETYLLQSCVLIGQDGWRFNYSARVGFTHRIQFIRKRWKMPICIFFCSYIKSSLNLPQCHACLN